MNHYKNIIALLLLIMVTVSCKKSFLELAPVSNANADNFFKSQSDFDLALNHAYATLYTVYNPKGSLAFCGELMSDNTTVFQLAQSGTVTIGDQWAFRDYTINSSNSNVYQFWIDYYSSLYHINIILAKIESVSLADTYKTEVKAEMKFLRGLYYFNMVQMFGDLPLVTVPILPDAAFVVTRSPKADVYGLIIADLKYAADNLPDPNKVIAAGRASKGAAKALLGKVYLTMGDKATALTTLKQVYDAYNGSQYDLLPAFTSVFGNTTAAKNTKESVFEIQYKGGATNPYSTYWPAYAPFENFTITKYGGGMNLVTDDLYNEFETGDGRRDASFYLGYTKANVFVPVKFSKKWVDLTAPLNGSVETCNNNFIVMRYAEVLLLLSEAGGDPQYLNKVRARAGLAAFGATGYPSAKYPTLDLAIEHERRMELALEFHRWFDLKRTGRAVAVLTAKGKPVNDNKLLLPIPQNARDQNAALTQNTGY